MGFNFHETINGTCPLCDKSLGLLGKLFRVPIFDPSSASNPQALAAVAGKAIHRQCWNNWTERPVVISLSLQSLRAEYAQGIQVVLGETIGAWINISEDNRFSNGVLFIPSLLSIFNNMMGVDIKGCEVRADASSIQTFLDIVINIDSTPGVYDRNGVSYEYSDFDDGMIRLDINSDDSDLKGTYLLSDDDIELLRATLKK